MTATELEKISAEVRYRIMQVSNSKRIPHLASSFSCVDILVALYSHMDIDPHEPLDENRDRLILSKGHAASALYTVLSKYGFFEDELLDTHGDQGSHLEEHPSRNCVPGVEISTGTLGHGLPVGCGMALAGKLKNSSFKTYIVLGDGECNEGTNWEAAMFASANKLKNLTVFVDYNKWQATSRSRETLHLESLSEKFRAFGWNSIELDGHNFEEINHALLNMSDKPTAVIAHTVKGKGVSFMEDDNNWHYRIPTEDELETAKMELGL